MRVLLDTQAFIKLSDQGTEGLSKRAKEIVEDRENERLLSAISLTEMAIKTSAGKYDIKAADVSKASEYLRLKIINYEPRHAMGLFDLPMHHKDPFDRMLIATALIEDIPILGADREFKRYKGLSVIW